MPLLGPDHDPLDRVLPDVARLRTLMVNLYFCGTREGWVLIDAGIYGYAAHIVRAAESLYGAGTRPKAIVLTHGHFDHVGSLRELVAHWDVPVYAHPLEMPYLTGRADYPPPDPTVANGAMAVMSWMYPSRAIDLGARVRPLPDGGVVPHLPEWRWLHTPGHAPGHVSLFRERDRCLIAGDAFVTTKQESFLSVATQRREIHGPPAYFTPDWDSARQSVRDLAALHPALALTGHGAPMQGEALAVGLTTLAAQFDFLAVPPDGRYVRRPALADEEGIVYLPPPVITPRFAAVAGIAALLATAVVWRVRSEE